MARIELQSVAKRWGDVMAVEPTDLVIRDGEFVAILGPSGCGKSTTLFMLAGIYAPSEGRILFDDAPVNDVEARDRNVGIVFQSYALYPHMTARDNIGFPLRFKRVQREESARWVGIACELERAASAPACSCGRPLDGAPRAGAGPPGGPGTRGEPRAVDSLTPRGPAREACGARGARSR